MFDTDIPKHAPRFVWCAGVRSRHRVGWATLDGGDGAANHQPGQLLAIGFGALQVCHQFAVAQHRDAIRNPDHFVEFVADKDDRQTLCNELLKRRKKGFAFLRCQHRGRFIEDQDLRAAIKRLQDFDALALANRKIPDPGGRINPQSEALGGLRDFPGYPGAADCRREQ